MTYDAGWPCCNDYTRMSGQIRELESALAAANAKLDAAIKALEYIETSPPYPATAEAAVSEQFSEMQALQDMEDARIGRSRAIQTRAGLAALNEPFCTMPEHAAFQARAEDAEAEVARLRSELETALKDAAYHSERRQHFKIEAGRAIVERDRLRSLLTDVTAALERAFAGGHGIGEDASGELFIHDENALLDELCLLSELLARLRAETPEGV